MEFKKKLEIRNLVQTCCPYSSQWEFRTFQNRPVYVRYRFGLLSISIGDPDSNIDSAVSGKQLYSECLGGPFDGTIDWEYVEPIIRKLPNKIVLI